MNKSLLLLPGPVTVAQPVLEAMARPMINHRGAEFAAMLARIETALMPVFGTRGDVLLLGCSGTGGLETAAVNLFSPGDVVLSCSMGVFGKRFGAIVRSYGCVVEMLDTPAGAAVDPDALHARLAADRDRRIAGILLTHNETSTGVQNDMAALVPAVRDHGAITLVDAVSGLGASRIRDGRVGLRCGRHGVAESLRRSAGRCRGCLQRARLGEDGRSRSAQLLFRSRARARSRPRGTNAMDAADLILYALDVALQRYHAEGMANAFERHARYARAVRAALQALGFTMLSRPGAHSDTVVAAHPPQGVDVAAFLRRLRERYGVVLSDGQAEFAGKIVRFGTMGDLRDGDIVGAIGAIELALADLDASPKPGAGTTAAIEVLSDRTPALSST